MRTTSATSSSGGNLTPKEQKVQTERKTARFARPEGSTKATLGENLHERTEGYRKVNVPKAEVKEKFVNSAEDAFRAGATTFIVYDSLAGLSKDEALELLVELRNKLVEESPSKFKSLKLQWDQEGEYILSFDLDDPKKEPEKII